PSSRVAQLFDGPVDRRLIKRTLASNLPRVLRLALPLGFAQLRQALLQKPTVFLGKLPNLLKDLFNGDLTHHYPLPDCRHSHSNACGKGSKRFTTQRPSEVSESECFREAAS